MAYAVEVYNKYHDGFYEKLDEFDTYEEACEYAKEIESTIDKESGEELDITEVEYEDEYVD